MADFKSYFEHICALRSCAAGLENQAAGPRFTAIISRHRCQLVGGNSTR